MYADPHPDRIRATIREHWERVGKESPGEPVRLGFLGGGAASRFKRAALALPFVESCELTAFDIGPAVSPVTGYRVVCTPFTAEPEGG